MSRCPPSSVAITSANYTQQFEAANAGISSCIPAGLGFVDSNGNVNSNKLNTWVESLLTKAAPAIDPSVITTAARELKPRETSNPAEDFARKSAALRVSIQNEYCFYYVRYQWALQTLLATATSPLGKVDPDLKNNTQELNKKLDAILLVMKGIVNSRLNTVNQYYSGEKSVNSLNNNLDTIRAQLVAHSSKLQSNHLETDIKSAMIDYSIEKNASSRNMLAVYGFMNIVAFGLLYYMYRSY